MAVIINQYYQAGVYRNDGTISLLNPAITMALVSKDYIPNLDADTIWADVSANEVAAGDGYTTGGQALTNLSLDRTGPLTTWDADDLTWASLTKAFKYGIIYINETVNSVVMPLIAVVDFDDSSSIAEVTSSGIDFQFQVGADGLFAFGPDTAICA